MPEPRASTACRRRRSPRLGGAAFALLIAALAPAADALEGMLLGHPIEADGRIELGAIVPLDSDTPYENPEGSARLRVRSALPLGLRAEAAFRAAIGGTPHRSRGVQLLNLDDTFQSTDPSLELEEALLDWTSAHLDVRAGLQRFAWGKLDGTQPNDLLNPRRWSDPFLDDEVDRKVAIPALAATLYGPTIPAPVRDLRLTIVWAPIATAFRFPDSSERWYPPVARVPASTVVNGFTVRNRALLSNDGLPSRSLDHGAVGLRLAALVSGVDVAIYGYDGTDTVPAFQAHARGFVRPDLGDLLGRSVRSEITIAPDDRRIHTIGADFAFSTHRFTVRGEAAYVSGRLYPRAIRDIVASERIAGIDLVPLVAGQEAPVDVTLADASVARDGFEWGLGADALLGDTFVLAQVNQTVLRRNDAALLVSNWETRFETTVRRGFLDDRLRAEMLGLYGMQGVYGVGNWRLTYAVTDAIDARIGFLLIAGHRDSTVGEFARNDETYVRLRYLF